MPADLKFNFMIDKETLLKDYPADEIDILKDFIKTYCEIYQEEFEKLKQSYLSKDLHRFQVSAHTFKGIFSYFKAPELVKHFLSWEHQEDLKLIGLDDINYLERNLLEIKKQLEIFSQTL